MFHCDIVINMNDKSKLKNSVEQKKSKVIVFANVKGGTGKSCLAALFCSYLHEMGMPVMLIDSDIQQTVKRHRERELSEKPEVTPPWSIESFNTSDTGYITRAMKTLKQLPACIVIDCPGNISDQALRHIFTAADICVSPVRYDSDNLDATLMFAKMFKSISRARMFFIPNSIVLIEERREEIQKARDSAVRILKPYGDVTARIKQSVVIKCYSTISPLERCQHNAVMYAFNPIIEYIKTLENEEE